MSSRDRFDPQHPQPQAGDDALVRVTVEALDASVETLPPGIDSRLRAARRDALAQASSASGLGWKSRVGIASTASLMLLVGAVVLLRPLFDAGPAPLPSIYEDEVQQLAAEELELLENLAFLVWLELQAVDADAV